jgi:uncharacterized membrane protein
VSIPATYLPAVYSLTAVGVWGTSDFLGGLGSRRANAFLFTSLVHFSGMTLAAGVALAAGFSFPTLPSVGWSFLAGVLGGVSLALFYRSLASGKMGLIAPISAVLSAAIPTVAMAFIAGFPGWRRILGFVLAVIGVWLISRTEPTSGRPEGIGMAVLAGCGFAGFYLCIYAAGSGSPVWIAVCSRFASFVVTVAIVWSRSLFQGLPRRVAVIAVIAGILDITGSIVFVRAAQVGRLDAAVVLSSLYPAVTVLLARVFLHEHFSRTRTLGMLAALAAVPMIAR